MLIINKLWMLSLFPCLSRERGRKFNGSSIIRGLPFSFRYNQMWFFHWNFDKNCYNFSIIIDFKEKNCTKFYAVDGINMREICSFFMSRYIYNLSKTATIIEFITAFPLVVGIFGHSHL